MRPLPGLTFALLLALAACGPSRDPKFVRALAEAERAQSAGRHGDAAALYLEAARVPSEPREREQALYYAAASYAHAGNRSEAARLYGEIGNGKGEYAARARFDLALLVLAENHDDGIARLERFVIETPSSALTRHALKVLLADAHEGKEGEAATIALLDRIMPSARGTELEERIRYELALAHERSGDVARARSELVAIADEFPYPKGALFDDALFRASQLDERLGHYDVAIADLERLLRDRETTALVGSYERRRYVPAAQRIAELYRDRIGDLDKARAAYVALFDEFKYSTARDDALFEAALISLRQNDVPRACSTMQRLAHEIPTSRYARCVGRVCRNAETAPGGTRPCGDYIEKRIDARR